MSTKEEYEESFGDRNILYLDYEFQHPGCNLIPLFCKILPLGETGWSIHGISVLFLVTICTIILKYKAWLLGKNTDEIILLYYVYG